MTLGWAVAALYVALLSFVAYRHVTRRPRLRDYAPRTSGPLVSVIIPARNEAVNIEPCVRSILAAAYEPLEVIVVDDRSTDRTGDLVAGLAQAPEARGRVRLIRGTEVPPGWFGKQWALVQGFRAARGELLLFADADTRHEPELIPRALTMLEAERAALVSVLPRQVMGSFWERLIQPHVFVALWARVGDLAYVNRTRVVWNAIANGQFILTPRAEYEAVGTHQAVRGTVADDVALAQAYVASGRDLFLAHAAEFMRTRMYRSLGEIVDGWSKNLALGIPLMMPPWPLVRRAAPYVMWLPSLLWLAPPAAWALTGWPFALAATVASLAFWVLVCWGVEAPLHYALLYPLGAAMVAYIMIRSAVRGRRKVEWRGRVYRGSGSHRSP